MCKFTFVNTFGASDSALMLTLCALQMLVLLLHCTQHFCGTSDVRAEYERRRHTTLVAAALASYTLPCQVQTVLHYAQYTDQSQIRANLDTPPFPLPHGSDTGDSRIRHVHLYRQRQSRTCRIRLCHQCVRTGYEVESSRM